MVTLGLVRLMSRSNSVEEAATSGGACDEPGSYGGIPLNPEQVLGSGRKPPIPALSYRPLGRREVWLQEPDETVVTIGPQTPRRRRKRRRADLPCGPRSRR